MKLMRNVILFGLNLFVCSSVLLAAELPSYKAIEMQINDAKKLDKNDSNNALVKHLEETRSLLEKIAQQKNDNEDLTKEIKGASVALGISQANIEKLKNVIVPTVDMLEKSSIGDLQKALTSLETELEMIQTELTTINGNLVAQNAVPDKAQLALADNATRRQMINAALGNTNLSSAEKVKFETELTLLDLQNGYNYDLLRGTEELTTLYNSQLDEKKLAQQNMLSKLANLQMAINRKLVEDSKNKVEQAEQSQQQVKADTNPLIVKELAFNTKISQELLKQTTDMSQLSQDNLRIKNVLENLQQTQRNIDE